MFADFSPYLINSKFHFTLNQYNSFLIRKFIHLFKFTHYKQHSPNFLNEDSRFLRDANFPLTGSGAILNYFEKDELKTWNSKPAGGMISSAGDFGFTYGLSKIVSRVAGEKNFNYIRVWMKDDKGEWKILSDTSIPTGD